MTIKRLTLEDAEFVAHALAVELMNSANEPIPPFDTRSPGRLESCLAEPFQTFEGKYLHRTFVERAAVLFYLICKNHCFANGNKRWFKIPPMVLYKIACDVAESDPRQREIIHEALAGVFKKYQVSHPWPKE